MNRRNFLRSAGFVSAGLAWRGPRPVSAQVADTDRWRTFELTTRIEVLKPSGATRLWMPTPLTIDTPYQKSIATTFSAPEGTARQSTPSALDGLGIVSAEFAAGAHPVLTVTSKVATRNTAVDLTKTGGAADLDRAARAHFLRSTKLMPTDGIVKSSAAAITKDARTDVDKARAIYEWIVENTFRDAKVRGCGVGDIRFMLESKNLSGKCADLNALYVGLARAAGLPARDVYGIRAAKSELGYRSLGTATEIITKAQHCRAEVFLSGHGWVPVDPADVRKVVLEEPPGNRPLDDAMVVSARKRLFGSWEMNWVAYNFAHDVALPGAAQSASIPFLMYPQAETAEGRIDSLDPDAFKYEITSREVAASDR
jgi:transglutaminase-like putative cysteine protease